MKKFIGKLKAVQSFITRILVTVMLALAYFIAVLPAGLLMRVLGRDRLLLRKPKTDTYWKNAETEKNDHELQF
ncbi:MAG: hypothetical protein FWF35_02475 [Elusimicrobia bacterium]|nr:hypothetical protein [Elusimicrobiota bacterium]